MSTDSADAYFAAGSNTIPLPAGEKWPPPPGITGWNGRYLASIEGYDWSGNIALRLAPDVVGVDVDVYAGGDRSLKELEERYGPLPTTWWSTSRDDGSGIAFFRVPFGTTLATDPAEGIDMIQAFHRYAVCGPSIHPKTGRPYRWVDELAEEDVDLPPHPADLPDLPWAWIEGLRSLKQAGADPITPGAARQFVDENTSAGRPGALLVAAIRSLDGVRAGGRHDALVRVACWIARESAAGWYSATEAFDRLHGWWCSAVSDDPRRADGGEFASAVLWAIGQAPADPQRLEQLRAELGARTMDLDHDRGRDDHRDGDDHRDQQHGDDDHPGDDQDPADPCGSARNLPEAFWDARPELGRIRQAAHAASLSADAVLGAALARVATLAPPTLTMDTGFGMPASMNVVIGLVGPSGAGKTTAVAAARKLVPIDRTDIVADVPLGSGEGLVDLFFETFTESVNGRKVRTKRRTKTAALACLDEGQALAEMGNRKGATLMPTIRSSWSGETIGQANASEETKRIVKAGTYRLALVVGFQATAVGAMLADQETGTAQRFALFSATDPTIPLEPTTWPEEVLFEVPPTITGQTVTVTDKIKKEIRARAHAVRSGAIAPDPLDSHRDLNRLKVAGLLAILAGRTDINLEDWMLAGMVMDTSDTVRRWVMDTNIAAADELESARTRAAIKRQLLAATALDNNVHGRAVSAGARAIARLAHKHKGETITSRDAARAPASKHRHEAGVDEMVAYAEAKEWIRPDGDGWVAGKSAPA